MHRDTINGCGRGFRVPSRTVLVLSIFFVLAVAGFTLSLLALARSLDLLACSLAVLGVLSLRGLRAATRAVDGGAR
ncbi:MAG: hypothetical protein AAF928_13215 [Myxococcota bacterium]